MLISNNNNHKATAPAVKKPLQFQLFIPLLCLLICSFITFASQVTIAPQMVKSASNIFAVAKSAVAKHGQLSIKNGQLVNQRKQEISLAGPSLYWSNNG